MNAVPAGHAWRWTLLAAVAGLASTFLFSGMLRLPRATFVAAHLVVVTAFMRAYAVAHPGTLLSHVSRRWVAGTLAGVLAGLFLVRQVLEQPASAHSEGLRLAAGIAWFGLVYGTLDALLLSVVPVMSLYTLQVEAGAAHPSDRLRWTIAALLGSALVTAAYHAGFTEYRGPGMIHPLIGNLIINSVCLVVGSPAPAIVSHVMMHTAAVIHGMETTVQLPPHY